MKTLFTFIVTILIAIPCFSQQNLLPAFTNEISYRGGKAYFNGIPFTGVLIDEKTSDKLGKFNKGYKNGVFTEYYSKGKKKSESNFVNGVKDGAYTEWFNNKVMRVTYNFVQGKVKDGKYIVYNENGQKDKQEIYADGNIIGNGIFKDGALYETLIEKYKNGIKSKEERFKDGMKDGISTWWYNNGEKKKEANYEMGKEVQLIYENNEDPELSIKSKREPGSNVYRIIDGVKLDTAYVMVIMNFRLNTGKNDLDKEVTPYFHELISTFLEGRIQKMSENDIYNNRKKTLGYRIEFSNFDFKLRRYPDGCQEACHHIGSASINMRIDDIISNNTITDVLYHPEEEAFTYYPGDTDFSVLKTLPYTLSGYIKVGMYQNFKVKETLNKITKLNKKGEAVEVSLSSNLSDYWKGFKFKVYINGDLNSIAKIEKANKNNNDLTFKVTEGADILTKYMNEGKSLVAISSY